MKKYLETMLEIGREDKGARESIANKSEAETIDALMLEMAAARWQLDMLKVLPQTMSSKQVNDCMNESSRVKIFVTFSHIRKCARDPDMLVEMLEDFKETVQSLALPDDVSLMRDVVIKEYEIQAVLARFAGEVPVVVQKAAMRAHGDNDGDSDSDENMADDSDDSVDEAKAAKTRAAKAKAGKAPRSKSRRDDGDDDSDYDDGSDENGADDDDDDDDDDDLPASKPPVTKASLRALREAIDTILRPPEDDSVETENDPELAETSPAAAAFKMAREALENIHRAFKAAQKNSRSRLNQKNHEKAVREAQNIFAEFEASHRWDHFIALLEEFMRYCQTFAIPSTPRLLRLLRNGSYQSHAPSDENLVGDQGVVGDAADSFDDGPATPQDQVKKPDAAGQSSPPPLPRSAAPAPRAHASVSEMTSGGFRPSTLLRQMKLDFLRRGNHSEADWAEICEMTPIQAREKVTDFVQSAVAANSHASYMPLTQSQDHHDDVTAHHAHQHSMDVDGMQQLTQGPASDDEVLNQHLKHHQQHIAGHVDHVDHVPDHDDDDDDDDGHTVVDDAKRLRQQSRHRRAKVRDPIEVLMLGGKPGQTIDVSPGSTTLGVRPRTAPKRKLMYDSNAENDSPFASQFDDEANRRTSYSQVAAARTEELFEKALARKRRKPIPWSAKESEALAEGVRVHGSGNWAAILREDRESAEPVFHKSRTSVSLKDRARNIMLKKQREKKAQEEAGAHADQ
ncbi:Telomere repeat-binding factor 4 [Hondaea fermentalgiana]|uniref:Telomere repeat-binding factor 4 n=1 Tax=Hondaea fermentalgiana TaxID=2315210 RepID=A0A2R5GP67_9STRA|nr:Telomere repeat-binding factor 4 [Hondaea fermentalgiana]|eukprot:GBG32667.1 Telomere repeat-binding factor 4 [Hondaea fermentalgiana]